MQDAVGVVLIPVGRSFRSLPDNEIRCLFLPVERSAPYFIESNANPLPILRQRARLLFAERRQPVRIRIERTRLSMAHNGQRAHFASSSLAMDSMCTSSGPSASRSVRELAHIAASSKSWHTPAAPCA